jgi:hypothetical protein
MEQRLLEKQTVTSPLVETTDRPPCTLLSTAMMKGIPMVTQGTQQPDPNVVVRNTKKIDKLIIEVEKLVDLLEAQRLVEPAMLHRVKRELHEIHECE